MSSQPPHDSYNTNNDDDDAKNNDFSEISLQWKEEEEEDLDDEEEELFAPQPEPKKTMRIEVELPREFGILLGARLGDRNHHQDPSTTVYNEKHTTTTTNPNSKPPEQQQIPPLDQNTRDKDHENHHSKNNNNNTNEERNPHTLPAPAATTHMTEQQPPQPDEVAAEKNHNDEESIAGGGEDLAAFAAPPRKNNLKQHNSSQYSLDSSNSSWATIPGASSSSSSAASWVPLSDNSSPTRPAVGTEEVDEEDSTRQQQDSREDETEDSTTSSSSFVPVHGMGALGVQNGDKNTTSPKTKTRPRSDSDSLASSFLSQEEASVASNATSAGCSYLYNDKDNESITTTASSILSGFDMLDINGQTVRICPLDGYRNVVMDGSSAAPAICQGCGAALVANPCPNVDYQIALHLQQKEEREALVQLQVAESKRQRLHERPLLEQADALVQELHQRVRHNFPFLVLPPLPAVSTTNRHHHHRNRSNAGLRSSQSGLSPLLLARMSGRYRFLSAMDLCLGAARFIETVQERYGRSNSCSAAMREAVEPPLPVHLAYMFTSKYEEEEEDFEGNHYYYHQQRSLERGEHSLVEVLDTPELAFQYWKSRNPPSTSSGTSTMRVTSFPFLPPMDEDSDEDKDDRGVKAASSLMDPAELLAVGWMVLVAPGRLDAPPGCGYSISNPPMPSLVSSTAATTNDNDDDDDKTFAKRSARFYRQDDDDDDDDDKDDDDDDNDDDDDCDDIVFDDDDGDDDGANDDGAAAAATTTTVPPQASSATAAATTSSSSLPPHPRQTFTVKAVKGAGAHLPLVCFDASVRNDAETTLLFKAMEQTCLDFLASLGVIVTNTPGDDMLLNTCMPPRQPTVLTHSSAAPFITFTPTTCSSAAAPVTSHAGLFATDAELASRNSGSSTSTTTTTTTTSTTTSTQPVPFPNSLTAKCPVATLFSEAAKAADCERLSNASPSPMLSVPLDRMTLEQENTNNNSTSTNNNAKYSTSTTTDDAANTAATTSNIQNSAVTSHALVEEQGDRFLKLDGWQMHYCPSCDELIRAFIPCPNGCFQFDENNDTGNSSNKNTYIDITATSTPPSVSQDSKLTTGTTKTTHHENTEAPASPPAGLRTVQAYPAFGELGQTKQENTTLWQPLDLPFGIAATTSTVGQRHCSSTTSIATPQCSNNSQPPGPLLHHSLLPLQQQSTTECLLDRDNATTAPSTNLPTARKMIQQFLSCAPFDHRSDKNGAAWRQQESGESSTDDNGNTDKLFEEESDDPLQQYFCDESIASAEDEETTITYDFSNDDDNQEEDEEEDGDNESCGMV
ncbi:hypothetical protein ACA910_010404 [Epithemia clementina (nom. ined.)]